MFQTLFAQLVLAMVAASPSADVESTVPSIPQSLTQQHSGYTTTQPLLSDPVRSANAPVAPAAGQVAPVAPPAAAPSPAREPFVPSAYEVSFDESGQMVVADVGFPRTAVAMLPVLAVIIIAAALMIYVGKELMKLGSSRG